VILRKPLPGWIVGLGVLLGILGLVRLRLLRPDSGRDLESWALRIPTLLEERVLEGVRKEVLPFFDLEFEEIRGEWRERLRRVFAALPFLESLTLVAPGGTLRSSRTRPWEIRRNDPPRSSPRVTTYESTRMMVIQYRFQDSGDLRYVRRVLPREGRFYSMTCRFRLAPLLSEIAREPMSRGIRIRITTDLLKSRRILFDSHPGAGELQDQVSILEMLFFGEDRSRVRRSYRINGGHFEFTDQSRLRTSSDWGQVFGSLILLLGLPLQWLGAWALRGIRVGRIRGTAKRPRILLDERGARPLTSETRELLGVDFSTGSGGDPRRIWPEAFGPGGPMENWKALLRVEGTIAPFHIEACPPGRKDRILALDGWGSKEGGRSCLILELRDVTELVAERRRKEALEALFESGGAIEALFGPEGEIVALGGGLRGSSDEGRERLEEWQGWLGEVGTDPPRAFTDAFGRRHRVKVLPGGFLHIREDP